MRRKGQYLAVESVLTFGLGLIVAIGTVTLFGDYRSQVVNQAAGRQADVIESRMSRAVQTLDDTDSGQIALALPEEIGSQEYSIVFEQDRLTVALQDGRTYHTGLEQFQEYSFKGSASGGAVKVFKRGEQFTLRAG